MTALDHRAATMPASVRPAIALRVVNAVADIFRAWKNRRQIYRLGEMSDAQLADLGLRRADLYVAWQTPLGRDPTAELGVMAEARALACETAARRVC